MQYVDRLCVWAKTEFSGYGVEFWGNNVLKIKRASSISISAQLLTSYHRHGLLRLCFLAAYLVDTSYCYIFRLPLRQTSGNVVIWKPDGSVYQGQSLQIVVTRLFLIPSIETAEDVEGLVRNAEIPVSCWWAGHGYVFQDSLHRQT